MTKKADSVYPLRHGFSGEPTDRVLGSVRLVITDWDGKDWGWVRTVLRRDPHLVRENFDEWTMNEIDQCFCIGQASMIRTIGGVFTIEGSKITPVRFNEEVWHDGLRQVITALCGIASTLDWIKKKWKGVDGTKTKC